MKDYQNEAHFLQSLCDEPPDVVFEQMGTNLLGEAPMNLDFISLVVFDVHRDIVDLKSQLENHRNTRKKRIQKRWMSHGEVKKLLCITRRTLHTLREDGRLPYSSIGGILFYKAEDVKQLFNTKYSKYMRTP